MKPIFRQYFQNIATINFNRKYDATQTTRRAFSHSIMMIPL